MNDEDAADSSRQQQTEEPAPPSAGRVSDYLLYGLSLPERALRSTSAVVSGAVRESADLLVPQAFRSSTTYRTLVEQTLDFLAKDVGGVTVEEDKEKQQLENYVARKAVGGFIEMASLPLLHVSPMMVLAIVSDVAYGSQSYLRELSDELKKHGVIDENSTIDHASDLLNAVQQTTSTTAQAFDAPPLSVNGLAETLKQVTEAASAADPTSVIPQAEVKRLWDEMHEIATREHVRVMDVSSTMTMYAMGKVGTLGRGALSTIKVAGNMFDRHILDHYGDGLNEIRDKGMYRMLAECSKPYIDAMWHNFSSKRETLTEKLFSGRLIRKAWRSLRSWFAGKSKEELPPQQ